MTAPTPADIRLSYLKTAVVSAGFVAVVVASSFLAFDVLPSNLHPTFVAIAVFGAVVAMLLATASVVVLARHRRARDGNIDLFLDLNASRTPAAIRRGGPARASRMRRWLAQRLLGAELIVGDLVEVRPWEEIRTTLDETACLGQLPFMPEMLAMCGRRAYVFRCMHRLFDYRKTRVMRHMHDAVLLVDGVCTGAQHGDCDAACHTVWRSAWLRRIDARNDQVAQDDAVADARPDAARNALSDAAVLWRGSRGPRYVCQLTQLHAASEPIPRWSLVDWMRPLVAGNVTVAAFAVAWLTDLFNSVQHLRGGVSFPVLEAPSGVIPRQADVPLRPNDRVVVRPSGEIRATLNDQFMHRGLWFEPDMLKHCGHPYRVKAEVRRLVDIVSGEILTMKTPAYVLDDVHFSGERQLFNAQYEPLYWRSAWLRRIGD